MAKKKDTEETGSAAVTEKPLKIPPELLEKAFQNTVEMLKREVEVVP